MELNDKQLWRTQAYVNGEWIDADDGGTNAVSNPSTGEVIAEIARCGTAETRRAIEAAHAAQPAWRAETAATRSRLLRRFFDLMMEHAQDKFILTSALSDYHSSAILPMWHQKMTNQIQ